MDRLIQKMDTPIKNMLERTQALLEDVKNSENRAKVHNALEQIMHHLDEIRFIVMEDMGIEPKRTRWQDLKPRKLRN